MRHDRTTGLPGTVNAYNNGCRCEPCRDAKAVYTLDWRQTRNAAVQRFDVAPLEDYLRRQHGLWLCDLMISGTAVKDWRRRGIPWYRADVICCKVGVHPYAVWGPEWEATVEDPEFEAWYAEWAGPDLVAVTA